MKPLLTGGAVVPNFVRKPDREPSPFAREHAPPTPHNRHSSVATPSARHTAAKVVSPRRVNINSTEQREKRPRRAAAAAANVVTPPKEVGQLSGGSSRPRAKTFTSPSQHVSPFAAPSSSPSMPFLKSDASPGSTPPAAALFGLSHMLTGEFIPDYSSPSASQKDRLSMTEKKLKALTAARKLRGHLLPGGATASSSQDDLAADVSGAPVREDAANVVNAHEGIVSAEEHQLLRELERLQNPWRVFLAEGSSVVKAQRSRQTEYSELNALNDGHPNARHVAAGGRERGFFRIAQQHLLTPTTDGLENFDAGHCQSTSSLVSLDVGDPPGLNADLLSWEDHQRRYHLHTTDEQHNIAMEVDQLWRSHGTYEHFTLKDAAELAGNSHSIREAAARVAIGVQTKRGNAVDLLESYQRETQADQGDEVLLRSHHGIVDRSGLEASDDDAVDSLLCEDQVVQLDHKASTHEDNHPARIGHDRKRVLGSLVRRQQNHLRFPSTVSSYAAAFNRHSRHQTQQYVASSKDVVTTTPQQSVRKRPQHQKHHEQIHSYQQHRRTFSAAQLNYASQSPNSNTRSTFANKFMTVTEDLFTNQNTRTPRQGDNTSSGSGGIGTPQRTPLFSNVSTTTDPTTLPLVDQYFAFSPTYLSRAGTVVHHKLTPHHTGEAGQWVNEYFAIRLRHLAED